MVQGAKTGVIPPALYPDFSDFQTGLDGTLSWILGQSPDPVNLEAGLFKKLVPLLLTPLDSSLHEHVDVHEEWERVRPSSGSRGEDQLADQDAGGWSHGVHDMGQDLPAAIVVVVVEHVAEVVSVCIYGDAVSRRTHVAKDQPARTTVETHS